MSDTATSTTIMTVHEAADWLRVSDRTLWSLTAPRGPIPVVRLSAKSSAGCRYRLEDLEKFAAERAAASIG